MSQREAAEFVGLPFWRYYHIERGWKDPTPEEVAQMTARFETTRAALFPRSQRSDAVA